MPIVRAATLPTPECPKWKQEKQVQQVRVEKQVSFPEASRLVDTRSGAVAGKSYATTVKVSTTNASVQTDLTWSNGADRFIKISDVQKARKQATGCVTGLFGFSESTGGLHVWPVTPEQACVKRDQVASEICLLEQKET